MAAGNFTSPLVTVANGDIIDATVRNNEFINILANANPTGLSGYQDNLAQKQLQEDPATGLVTSLGKELEQLRFALKRILGETYWYTAPDTDLAAALFSGKAGDVVLGDGTKTTTDPLLTLNADTGDAGIRLQVNDTSANAWDIYNDNSDSDRLKFDYNGVTKVVFNQGSDSDVNIFGSGSDGHYLGILSQDTGGSADAGIILRVNNTSANDWQIYNDNSDGDRLKLRAAGPNDRYEFKVGGTDTMKFECQNITTSTAPEANTLYPHSMVKAWANINGGVGPTLADAFNIQSVSRSGTGAYLITFRTAMADTNYCIQATAGDLSGDFMGYEHVVARPNSTTQCSLFCYTGTSTPSDPWRIYLTVIGRQ